MSTVLRIVTGVLICSLGGVGAFAVVDLALASTVVLLIELAAALAAMIGAGIGCERFATRTPPQGQPPPSSPL